MRKCLLLVMLLALSVSTFASRPQRREVIKDTVCNAPLETMLKVAERFCYQFQACPDSLFDWAYLNMDESKEIEP